ncbi:hypothetical protein AB0A76_36225, partial [Streptomyces exfoliatus]
GEAAPAGASRRGGWTGRAETSGERPAGTGRTGPRGAPPVEGVALSGAPIPPPTADARAEVEAEARALRS